MQKISKPPFSLSKEALNYFVAVVKEKQPERLIVRFKNVVPVRDQRHSLSFEWELLPEIKLETGEILSAVQKMYFILKECHVPLVQGHVLRYESLADTTWGFFFQSRKAYNHYLSFLG